MRINDLFGIAVVGLKRRKIRTLLTVSGVIVGTVSIILMFSLGLADYQHFQEKWIDDNSLLQIKLSPKDDALRDEPTITEQELLVIADLNHVSKVSPIISFPVTVKADQYQANLFIMAIDPGVTDFALKEGNFLSSTSDTPNIILGYNLLTEFVDSAMIESNYSGDDDSPKVPSINWLSMNMNLTLGYGDDENVPSSKSYRINISGITSNSYDQDSYYTYMNITSAQKLLSENKEIAKYLGIPVSGYSQAVVMVDNIDNVESVLIAISNLGLQAYSPLETINKMKQELLREQEQLFAISLITLFVSAIGIANTMYANILERQKEIGIMKVLGTPIASIRKIYMLEAAGMGLLGGILGIVISNLLAFLFQFASGEIVILGIGFSNGIGLLIPWWLDVGALAISTIVGMISGIYPAYKASCLSPMEAMGSF